MSAGGFAVLLYEYTDDGQPLVGRRDFATEREAERFAWFVAGREVPFDDRTAVVSLACVWECDGAGELVRPTGEEFEG